MLCGAPGWVWAPGMTSEAMYENASDKPTIICDRDSDFSWTSVFFYFSLLISLLLWILITLIQPRVFRLSFVLLQTFGQPYTFIFSLSLFPSHSFSSFYSKMFPLYKRLTTLHTPRVSIKSCGCGDIWRRVKVFIWRVRGPQMRPYMEDVPLKTFSEGC